MNVKLLLTSSVFLGLCCCGFAQKGKMIESRPPFLTTLLGHMIPFCQCHIAQEQHFFPTSRPLLWGEELMMSLTRSSILASWSVDPDSRQLYSAANLFITQPDAVAMSYRPNPGGVGGCLVRWLPSFPSLCFPSRGERVHQRQCQVVRGVHPGRSQMQLVQRPCTWIEAFSRNGCREKQFGAVLMSLVGCWLDCFCVLFSDSSAF